MRQFVKHFVFLIVFIFIFAFINNASQIVYADGDNHNHDGMTAWESTTSLPTSGSYYLVNDVTISATCSVSGTLNLCLNGHGIRFTGTNNNSGSVFFVGDGKTLNLYDCGTNEHKFRMVVTDTTNIFNYVNNVIICTAGQAIVDDSLTEDYETFIGGYITGGIGTSVYSTIYGGAVRINGGTFNMYGGSIIGNRISSSSSSRGAGVGIQGGTFNMYGGSIIGNSEVSNSIYGGGVFVGDATINSQKRIGNFNMYGGIIERNVAATGGGIFVGSGSSNLTITGGAIKGNACLGSVGSGGGILVQNGTINISNCEISGNIASVGGGLYMYPYIGSSGATSILNMTNCDIFGNFGRRGSAIKLSGEVWSSGNKISLIANISNTHVHDNFVESDGTLYFDGYSQIANIHSMDITLNDCLIEDNKCIYSSIAGLYMTIGNSSYSLGPKVTLNNCSIINNIAEYPYDSYSIGMAGLFYGNKSELNLSGKIVINGNKFHNTQTEKEYPADLFISQTTSTALPVKIIGDLTSDSIIGVMKYSNTINNPPIDGTGIATNGLNAHGSIENFFCTSNEHYISLDNNGELVLKLKAKVIYNRNGYSGSAPSNGYFIPGVEQAVVSENATLNKTGYSFAGWNTLADGTGTLYKPGDTFDISGDITLYAIFEHGSHDDVDFVLWTDELALEQNGEGATATNSLPSVAGDYYIDKDVTLPSTWIVPNGTTNLCLNGRGIKLSGSGSVFIVNNGAILNIHNCDTSITHYFTRPTVGKATNISDTNSGGQNSFSGGYISGGTGTNQDGDVRGGAILIASGGIVNFNGGRIIGNSAQYGGAIYIDEGAKLTMGGSAYIWYNQTTGSASWYSGGGVYIVGEFVMNGGYIQNNYSVGNRGGAVQIETASGVFKLNGGSIEYNYSEGDSGAGICVWGGTLEISGNPVVRNNKNHANNDSNNNIFVSDKTRFLVVGELKGGNNTIGISMETPGMFTNTSEENKQYNKSSVFFCDNSSYKTVIDNDQIMMIPSNTMSTIVKDNITIYCTSISEAISNWTDGSTLKLLEDVSGVQITVDSGTKTLDLNNHSITYTNGTVIIVSGGELTIVDTSANKTKHYYTPNQTGVATLSGSVTSYYFEGGYITGGVATDSRGGGLRVTGGTVNFAGGTIFACRAGWGGGIWTAGNSLTRISDSAAIIGCYSSGAYTSGGGIFCEGSGAITMTGGSIRHNSSQYSGGGVRVSLQESTGTYFTMTGGEITGNYSGSHQGSGLALDMAKRIKIGGSAKIYGNDGDDLFLKNGGYVTVVEEFSEDALIYVKTQTTPAKGAPITITDGWSDIMGDVSSQNVFKWNTEDYVVRKNSSGELVASTPHSHEWVYTVDDNVITATCQSEDCPIESLTLTLDVTGKVYDGTAVSATISTTSDWSSSNGLATIGDIEYTGNTDVGTYVASITIGDVTAEKEFTIEKLETVVTITGHNSEVDYDGEEHGVIDFDVEVDTTLYDILNDFEFSGLANAERVNAGKTLMGLESSMFTNTNDNFDVTFEVIDGYITIDPIDVLVTITGHNEEVNYNGELQSAIGYEVEADIALYDLENDLVFNGTTNAKRINVGMVPMGLEASMFTNINENFNVTFEVIDGFIVIVPTDVLVTITGHNKVTNYNGKAQRVSGYDVKASVPIYNVDMDLMFIGLAKAEATNAGTSRMGLSSNMFTNINNNFNVTFEVIDGYITVNPAEVTVKIIGHNEEISYDGEYHSVSGYDVEVKNSIYDIEKDITFIGNAKVEAKDAETYQMGLDSSMFTNSNINFNVTFEVVDGYIIVNPMDILVTITGHNEEISYDGENHSVIGYDTEVSSTLYDVEKDLIFTGNARVDAEDVATNQMGLESSMFSNINNNFNVTFEVVDGFITVNPADIVITITGHNEEINYDGKSHSVIGYDAKASSTLYDVGKDLTFTGIAKVDAENVETYQMGLEASMFRNRNNNFNVTFEVVDGFITILAIDPIITTLPQAKELTVNGLEQELIVKGEVIGGIMYYALTSDINNIPSDSSYSEALPTAINEGTYFIWYKVVGDENHNDLNPTVLKAVLEGEKWVILSGSVYRSDGETELSNVKVSLTKGNQVIDYTVTDENGEYIFKIKKDIYNIVAEFETYLETLLVEAFTSKRQDIVMFGAKTESRLEVNTEDNSYLGISVGGLEAEARSIRNNDDELIDSSISLLMTVEPKEQEAAKDAEAIVAAAENKSLEFLEIKIEKTVDAVTTILSETVNVLEIVVPYEKINRQDITVYSYHGSEVRTFTEIKAGDPIKDGSFRLDKENHYIYIYSSCFSTFAIGYTPHYKFETTLVLGTYKGKGDVTLVNQDDGTIYTASNVELGKISFSDVPSGNYVMNVTWEDGVKNTLSINIKVDGENFTAKDVTKPNNPNGEIVGPGGDPIDNPSGNHHGDSHEDIGGDISHNDEEVDKTFRLLIFNDDLNAILLKTQKLIKSEKFSFKSYCVYPVYFNERYN